MLTSPQIITADEILRVHVTSVCEQLNWNMVQTSRALDVDRRTLYRWLKAWGVDPSEARGKCPHCAGELHV